MREGHYIIGGVDLRNEDLGPPSKLADRRIADRYILLSDPTVSHQHAELIVADGDIRIVDLGSPRGTYIRDGGLRRRVYECRVEPDTAVELGRCRCTIADLIRAAEHRGNLSAAVG